MPPVDVAAPEFNISQTLQLAGQAASEDAVLVVFPELGLSAYSKEDFSFKMHYLMRLMPDSIACLICTSRFAKTSGFRFTEHLRSHGFSDCVAAYCDQLQDIRVA